MSELPPLPSPRDLGRHVITRVYAARLDLALVLVLTIIAAVLRLVLLNEIPPGLHGDEGIAGLEARNILDSGYIGAYSRGAGGTPAGTFYWTAAVFWLFGDSEFTLRLSFALLGIMTIPLAYFAFKVMFGRPAAFIAAFLLTTSAWHLHYSRVAFVPVGWPLAEVGTMLALFLALRYQSRLLYGLSGVVLAFGIYTYGGYPTFAIAVAAFLVYLAVVHYRSELVVFTSRVAVLVGMALLVGLPMASWARDNPDIYKGRLETYSITKTEEYRAADSLVERGRVIAEREWDFVQLVTDDPVPDGADAAGVFPLVNRIMLVLLGLGGVLALWRWKRPSHAFLIIGVILIALGPAVTTEAPYRRSLGLTPLLAGIAALPLALVWEEASKRGVRLMLGAGLVVVLAVGGVAGIDLGRYFTSYDDNPHVSWVFVSDLARASRFIDALPDDVYVYFYSDRHLFGYETRQYIAPDAAGEDRSAEWGQNGFDLTPDRSRDVVYVFQRGYVNQLSVVEAMYPGGTSQITMNEVGDIAFASYFLPSSKGPTPSATEAPAATATPESSSAARDRDAARVRDLAGIRDALGRHRAEHGSYPNTGGSIQTLCVFEGDDAGCELRDVLDPLPGDPLGSAGVNGYWYQSNGDGYVLYAQRESDAVLECDEHPTHLAMFESLICAKGP